jgi:hypothetical protein
MRRIHFRITTEAETEQFLCEKASTGGGVTVVTLTSAEAFAAKNLTVYGREAILI